MNSLKTLFVILVSIFISTSTFSQHSKFLNQVGVGGGQIPAIDQYKTNSLSKPIENDGGVPHPQVRKQKDGDQLQSDDNELPSDNTQKCYIRIKDRDSDESVRTLLPNCKLNTGYARDFYRKVAELKTSKEAEQVPGSPAPEPSEKVYEVTRREYIKYLRDIIGEENVPLRIKRAELSNEFSEFRRALFLPLSKGDKVKDDDVFFVSDYMKVCEREATNDWGDFINGGGPEKWKSSITQLEIEAALMFYVDSESGEPVALYSGESNDSEGEGESLESRKQSYAELLATCEALTYATGETDYSDTSLKGGGAVQAASSGAAGCTGSQDPQGCQAQVGAAGPTQCIHSGHETQDFAACQKIITYIDGFFIAKQGLTGVQQIRATNLQGNEQIRIQEQVAAGEGVTNADLLESQKATVEQQSRLAAEQGALDAATAATLTTLLASMPTKESLYESCIGGSDAIDDVIRDVSKVASKGNSGINADDACASAVNRNNQLILNAKARDAIKLILAKAATDAITNAARAALLKQQANKIQDAIDSFQDRTNLADVGSLIPEPLEVSVCLTDPSAAGCIQSAEASSIPIAGTNFNFAGNQRATSGLLNPDGDAIAEGLDTGGSDGRGVIPGGVGSVIPEGEFDNSFIDAPPPGATAKNGSFSGGAGGGGGGGGARLANSQAPSGGGAPAAKSNGSGSGVKIGFSGTGSGAARFARGGKGSRRKKSSSKNPFGKLIGKSRKPSSLLKFKDQIGGKKGSLFQQISTRYGSVVQKKRLLDYEQKK